MQACEQQKKPEISTNEHMDLKLKKNTSDTAKGNDIDPNKEKKHRQRAAAKTTPQQGKATSTATCLVLICVNLQREKGKKTLNR